MQSQSTAGSNNPPRMSPDPRAFGTPPSTQGRIVSSHTVHTCRRFGTLVGFGELVDLWMYIHDVCDIYMMFVRCMCLLCSLWSLCDVIYINLSFVWMEIKKQKKYFKISLVFAEGLGHSPRQRKIKKNRSLPRALTIALGKEFLRKNKKRVFAEGVPGSPRQRNY